MIELILFYILPNIMLFGGICLASKYYEKLTWELIVDMCNDKKEENILRKAIYSII